MSAALQVLACLRERWSAVEALPDEATVRAVLWHGLLIRIAGHPMLMAQQALDSVIPRPAVTRLPGTQPQVLGIASWQGALLPVFSTEVLCGEAESGSSTGPGYCLVVRRRGFHFALTIPELGGPVALPADSRCDQSPAGGPLSSWCAGAFPLGENLVAVLDVDRMLEDPRLTDTALPWRNTEDCPA